MASRARSASAAVRELRLEACLLAKSRVPLRDHGNFNNEDGVCQLHQESRDALNAHETTIIVYDNEAWTRDFRDFVRLSWRMQQDAIMGGGGTGTGAVSAGPDLSQHLQLVVFHPEATHHTCQHPLTSRFSSYSLQFLHPAPSLPPPIAFIPLHLLFELHTPCNASLEGTVRAFHLLPITQFARPTLRCM